MRRTWWAMCRAVWLGVVVAAAQPASAITINVTYDPFGAPPGTDPTGIGLINIANAAATLWEDIIEDPWTVDVTIRYQNLGSGLANGTMTSTLVGKPTAGTINIDNGTNFWIDPTPLDSSEFAPVSTTYDQLTAMQQSSWYIGSVPDVLEASFRGTATSGAASTNFDLFSTVFHEMGHVLGMSDPLAAAETLIDFNYNVAPFFVGGNAVALPTAGTDPSDVDDYGHIAAQSLMCRGCAAQGLRRLPAATDVFAIAAASNWVSIDLPNKYLNGTSYTTASNWIGNRVPDLGDDVFVRTGGFITMSGGGSAGNLNVTDNSLILTGAHLLNVADTVTLADDPGGSAQIIIGAGGELQADMALVGVEGEIDLAGGVLDTNDLNLSDATSRLTGAGFVFLSGPMDNLGVIRPDGGTMTINNSVLIPGGTVLARATGEVDVTAGDLTANAAGGVVINGDLTVGAGRTANFLSNVELASGQTTLTGGGDAGSKATLASNGTITIDTPFAITGWADLAGDVTLDTSTISLSNNPRVELGSTTLDTITVIGTPSSNDLILIGNGTVIQQGDLVVMPDNPGDLSGKIVTTVYDMDGGGSADVTVQGGFELEIDALRIEENIGDGYDGVATIEQGVLNINTHGVLPLPGGPTDVVFPWRLDGTLDLDGDAALEGSPVQVMGTVTAGGFNNFIDTPLTLENVGTIDVPTGATLTLRETATFDGGAITGAGTLRQDANINVTSDTTVNTAVFDWGNSLLLEPPAILTIDPGVTLDVRATGTGTTDNPYRGRIVVDSGTLSVNIRAGWSLPTTGGTFPFLLARGELYLNDTGGGTPIVTGQSLRNSGLVSGVGEINTTFFSDGEIAVGHAGATGILTIGDDLLLDGGTLLIEIGGLTPGSEYDRLVAGADAEIDPGVAIDLALLNGFVPDYGQTFDVLTASGLFGTFDSIVGGLQSSVALVPFYSATTVTIRAVIPGDFDFDGDVDLGDFNTLAANFSLTSDVTFADGDVDQDGDVDLDDFNTFAAFFGFVPESIGALPEPGALTLVAMGLLFGLRRRGQ